MNRNTNLQQLKIQNFDICIIGAGASGAGAGLDAALRGLKVALIDKNDFAAETSSKSTKLVHGGVRYLEMAFKNLDFGQLKQVQHGLQERHILLHNAPHLAYPLALITPVFSWFEGIYYTIGLKLYGFFAKNDSLPKASWLNKKETFEHIPTLTKRLHSSVMYYDGQLDDARYCLALVQTAHQAGTSVANHVSLLNFEHDKTGKLQTARVRDELSGEEFELKSKLFINCTGAFSDSVRLMANPALDKRIKPSKGVHLVLPAEVLKSKDAMLIPKTKDGRVVYVIPFQGKVMVGTTDDGYDNLDKEPRLESNEVDFLLDTLRPFLEKMSERTDITAGFGGIRPLITAGGYEGTKKLLRDHEVEHDTASNLLSLLGGKWTTYRLMAEDVIDKACEILENTNTCKTAEHRLVGAENYTPTLWQQIAQNYNLADDIAQNLAQKYGDNALKVAELANNSDLANRVLPDFPFIRAEVVYQMNEEMACTPRDVLARRWRLELTDWQATLQALPVVAELMQTSNEEVEAYKKIITEFEQAV